MSVIRTEPYRVLFPLGIALAWAGVSPWFALGVGASEQYQSIFHALVQVQGFLACFVAGFLLTFVPRRTETEPASWVEIGIAAACPIGVTISAWLEEWAISQMFWLVFAANLLALVVRRFARARDAAPPATASWIPAALLGSIAGSILSAMGAARPDGMWLHDVGRGMALQGFPAALVLGAGAFLLPVITRGTPPAAATPTARIFHGLAATAFFATFVLEAWSMRAGFALRAIIATAVLIGAASLHRPPTLPGAHRMLAWIAAWCVPAGFALVALFPSWKRIALHVTFLGGFAALTFAVSIQIAHAHAMRTPNPRLVRTLMGLLAAALAFRLLVDLDRVHFSLWIALASGSFLGATLVWALTVASALRSQPRKGGNGGLPIRG